MANIKKKTYKYTPESFTGILGLSDELEQFYKLYEEYLKLRTPAAKFILEKHSRDLFFTIKHRMIEGALTQQMAHEIRDYVEELLHD
jgi:hypothetical protein